MRPETKRLVLGAWCLVLGAATVAHAQGPDSARGPQDSVLARARQLVRSGKDADGRRLIDSILAITTPDSARYGEALYWRGTLAATAADAERDYRRLLIEAPLSPRAEEALLQLAQLELARGDRSGASDHLQRFLMSYPQNPARLRVSVQLVRLLFDQGPQQLARACDMLRTTRAEVPASNVELRNQLDANSPRCAYVEATPVAPPVVADSAVAPPVPDSAARPAGAPAAAPPVAAPPPAPTPPAVASAPSGPSAFYSVQVAAYDSPEAAERMVKQLVAIGAEARVDGKSSPYRVRVGKFGTRAQAVKAAADLKAKGHSGFITLVNTNPGS